MLTELRLVGFRTCNVGLVGTKLVVDHLPYHLIILHSTLFDDQQVGCNWRKQYISRNFDVLYWVGWMRLRSQTICALKQLGFESGVTVLFLFYWTSRNGRKSAVSLFALYFSLESSVPMAMIALRSLDNSLHERKPCCCCWWRSDVYEKSNYRVSGFRILTRIEPTRRRRSVIKHKRDWAYLVKSVTRHTCWDNRLW